MPPSSASSAPPPAAPAAAPPAAPDAVVDYEKLTFALRPAERTRPARAARLAVRESCTVFPRSHPQQQPGQQPSAISGGGGGSGATKKDAKAKTKAKGGILKTPRKSGSSPTAAASAATAMDVDGGGGADNQDGQDGSGGGVGGGGDDDDDDDASADIGGGGSSAPSDDKVDRSVEAMYVMDGDTGRIVATARVRPVVVRDGLLVDDDDDDDDDDDTAADDEEDAAATKGGGYEEVVGYEEIDDDNNDDGDAMDIDADGADGSASAAAAAAAAAAATKKSTPTKADSTPPGAASTSASSAEEGEEEEETDSGDEEYVPGSDPLTALQDQLPLESLPGRPTISFRRAEADGRLVALLKSRSAVAEDIVRGLARTTDEYSRHVRDGAASSAAEEGGARGGGGSGLASLIMKDANSDETELRRRLRLEKRRLAMERPGTRSYLPPDLHEVMLGNWESQIDWEGVKVEEVGSSGGGGSGSSDMTGADAAGSNPLAAGVAIMAEKAKSSSASALTVVRPPRKKLMDPQALLSTPYNPELDSMDFASSVSWLGADAPPGHNTALARSVPLVLERSVAGRSVALPAAAPPVRPLPFGATNVFEARYERELSTVASSTASSLPGSSFRPDGDKLEAIIKAKQERRQKLATKKSHRIMEAMGTLGLGGGKGRTITSSLMGPGGTERTGRVARGVAGGTSAHDAEYVEQLEMSKCPFDFLFWVSNYLQTNTTLTFLFVTCTDELRNSLQSFHDQTGLYEDTVEAIPPSPAPPSPCSHRSTMAVPDQSSEGQVWQVNGPSGRCRRIYRPGFVSECLRWVSCLQNRLHPVGIRLECVRGTTRHRRVLRRTPAASTSEGPHSSNCQLLPRRQGKNSYFSRRWRPACKEATPR